MDFRRGKTLVYFINLEHAGFNEIAQFIIQNGGQGAMTFLEAELIEAAKTNDAEKAVRLLSEQNVSPNCKDNDGQTPLHHACAHRSLQVCRVLLQNGADSTIVDRFGISPMDEAIRNKKRLGNDKIVALLQSREKPNRVSFDIGYVFSSIGKVLEPFVLIMAVFEVLILILIGLFSSYGTYDPADQARYPMYQGIFY